MSEKQEEGESQQLTLTETQLPTLSTEVEATIEETKEHESKETQPIEIVVNDENQAEETPSQFITALEEPSLPQIIINDSQSVEPMPDIAINGESLVIDEPQTPVPSDVMSETTADDSSTTASSHSTVISESLNNDDTKPIVMDESDFQGPVIEFYKNKNILMTGVTGFIGKAILWKLIQALRQDLGYIYILIRSGSIKRSKIGRPSERLRNEVFNNKVKIRSTKIQFEK
jgi:FlaA1/EpsC-like NDP-sugar epimerase